MHKILLQKLNIVVSTTLVSLSISSIPVPIFTTNQVQATKTSQANFGNYPAIPIFHGQPARLMLKNQEIKDYESELKAIVRKGTNFAGHYAIADGLNRAMGGVSTAVIVDLKTGKVYLPKQLHGYHDQRGAGYTPSRPDGGLHYQANSKLLIIVGRAGGSDGQKGIGRYYYKWENNQLQLLKFRPD